MIDSSFYAQLMPNIIVLETNAHLLPLVLNELSEKQWRVHHSELIMSIPLILYSILPRCEMPSTSNCLRTTQTYWIPNLLSNVHVSLNKVILHRTCDLSQSHYMHVITGLGLLSTPTALNSTTLHSFLFNLHVHFILYESLQHIL